MEELIKQLQNDIRELRGGLNASQAGLTTAQAEILAAQDAVATAQAEVRTAQSEVTTAKAMLKAAFITLGALSVGFALLVFILREGVNAQVTAAANSVIEKWKETESYDEFAEFMATTREQATKDAAEIKRIREDATDLNVNGDVRITGTLFVDEIDVGNKRIRLYVADENGVSNAYCTVAPPQGNPNAISASLRANKYGALVKSDAFTRRIDLTAVEDEKKSGISVTRTPSTIKVNN